MYTPTTKLLFLNTDTFRNSTKLRLLFDNVGKELNILRLEDWYNIPVKPSLQSSRTFRLFSHVVHKYYDGSLVTALKQVYPEHKWQFSKVPNGYWKDVINQRQFFDSLKTELKLNQPEDWYTVTLDDCTKHGGTGLLPYFKNSLAKALMTVYPELDWKPWQFRRLPSNWLEDQANQRRYLQSLSNKLGITNLDDWYRIRTEDLLAIGGSKLLAFYGGSMIKMLTSLHPNHTFAVWKFNKTPSLLWDSASTLRNYMKELQISLHVHKMEDWYRIGPKQLRQVGAEYTVKKLGGLAHLLPKCFPEYNWNTEKLDKGAYKAGQWWLKATLAEIFAGHEIYEDYVHPQLTFSKSQKSIYMELDLFIPSLSIAFEYQGIQHYEAMYFWGYSVKDYEQRDQEKLAACCSVNITLIQIPYWWDGSTESLLASIRKIRPDLISTPVAASPIPSAPPQQIKQEAIIASKLQLARDWNIDDDPTGWIMSEKLDGVRAFWTGEQLYSKYGKVIHAPKRFVECLPKMNLDGELYINKGLFYKTLKIWKEVNYWVFDTPGFNKPYQERWNILNALKASFSDHIKLVPMQVCQGKEHMIRYFNSIVSEGGEGIILRDQQAIYEPGRSNALRKLKPHKDVEGKVISIDDWGLTCELPNGQRCVVRCDAQTIMKPPNPGSIITIGHDGFYDSGKLVSPYFLRECPNTTWDEIMKDFQQLEARQFSDPSQLR